MKIRKLLFSLAVILLIGSCSLNNSYKRAHDLYNKENYVSAINFYDDFLELNTQGINVTMAELERSDCYFQLGMKAYEKQNWLLAIRLYYLANSVHADQYMDNCYFELAEQALQQNDQTSALEYYDYILENLSESELVPKILVSRIMISSENSKQELILSDYQLLYKNYPDYEIDEVISNIADDIIEHNIDDLQEKLSSENYEQTLSELQLLAEFPTKHLQKIDKSLARSHVFIADMELSDKNYTSVVQHLHQALDYDGSMVETVENKLLTTFQFFIDHGNDLADQLKFDEALNVLDQCLQIYPDFKPAINSRERIVQEKRSYTQAVTLEKQALEREMQKEYQEALKLYEMSYNNFQNQNVEEKIQIMKNILRAEKDPRSFALNLIKEYRKGKILVGIGDLESELIEQYGENIVSSSGWKIQYSTGEYKYEVRYDILSPDKNYYYVWLTDLKKGIISPLNKISEGLM